MAGDSGISRPGIGSPLHTQGVIDVARLMRLPLRFPLRSARGFKEISMKASPHMMMAIPLSLSI